MTIMIDSWQWCYNNIVLRWRQLTSDDENYVRFLQLNNNNIVIGNDFDEEVTERCNYFYIFLYWWFVACDDKIIYIIIITMTRNAFEFDDNVTIGYDDDGAMFLLLLFFIFLHA